MWTESYFANGENEIETERHNKIMFNTLSIVSTEWLKMVQVNGWLMNFQMIKACFIF